MASPWDNAPEVTGPVVPSGAPWDTAEEVDPFEGTVLAKPKPFHGGQYLLGNAVEGALSVPDIPASMEALGKRGAQAVNNLLLPHRVMPEDSSTLLPQFHLDQKVDTPNKGMEPPNEAWKLGGTAAKFAGAGVPLGIPKLLTANPGSVSEVFGSLLGGIPANAASGAGAQLMEDSGPDWMSPEVRQLLGASMGQKLLRGAVNTPLKMIPGISSPNENVQALDRLGVTPKLVADVSGNPVLGTVQRVGAELLGGGKLNKAVEENKDLFSEKTHEIADKFGQSGDYETGGSAVQNLGRKWVADFRGKGDGTTAVPQGQFWDRFWDRMGPDTAVDSSPWRQYLQKNAADNPWMTSLKRNTTAQGLLGDYMRTANMQTAELFEPGTFENRAVPSDNIPSGLARIEHQNPLGEWDPLHDPENGMSWTTTGNPGKVPPGPAPATPGPHTYTYPSRPMTASELKEVHTEIGNMLGDPNLPTELNKTFLTGAYKTLSGMLEDAAAKKDAQTAAASPQGWQVGPNGLPSPPTVTPQNSALQAYKEAQTYTKKGHEFIENVLTPFVKDGSNAATAMKSLLSGANRTGEQIAALRENLPQAANEAAATRLRLAAHPDSSRPNDGSPVDFSKNFKALSAGGRDALFGNDQDVTDLNTWAHMSHQSGGLTKGLANIGAYLEAARLAWEGGRAGFEAGHVPGAIMGAAAAGATPFLANKMVTAPLVSEPLARALGRTGPQIPKPTLDVRVPGATVRVPHYLPLALGGLATPREQQ